MPPDAKARDLVSSTEHKRVLRVLPFKRVLEHKLLGTPIRRWIVRAAAATAIVLVALSGYWTIRHAWAIYKLNRGVGDTVFYDADDHPWFRLDEQRQDVPSNQISTFFKDAVIVCIALAGSKAPVRRIARTNRPKLRSARWKAACA